MVDPSRNNTTNCQGGFRDFSFNLAMKDSRCLDKTLRMINTAQKNYVKCVTNPDKCVDLLSSFEKTYFLAVNQCFESPPPKWEREYVGDLLLSGGGFRALMKMEIEKQRQDQY